MPFEHGSFTVSIFELRDALPDNYLELFAAQTAGMLDNVKDEPQIGWVSGRHLLENNIEEKTALRGGCLYLNLRKAERKMPASLLNAICKREELIYLQANNAQFVSGKVKKQIREEALEKHLMKMPPQIAGVPLVVDLATRSMYVGASSPTQIDDFIGFFFKTTNVEPLQLTPASLLETMFQTTLSSFPSIRFAEECDDEPAPGRDFLTWLWYYSETAGKLSHPQYGEFDLLIEAPATFAFTAEARGAAETSIKKGGSPLRSAEAKAALTVGKKVKKAKFSLTRGDDIWSGVFDADRFSFSSFNLPEGENLEPESRFAERMLNLFIFQEALKLYFHKFAESLLSMSWPEEEKNIRRWVEERDSI